MYNAYMYIYTGCMNSSRTSANGVSFVSRIGPFTAYTHRRRENFMRAAGQQKTLADLRVGVFHLKFVIFT